LADQHQDNNKKPAKFFAGFYFIVRKSA